MPVEPVTPPGSKVWRVVHFPVMLGVVAVGLLLLAVLAIDLLSFGFGFVGYVPGARYLTPLIGAAAIVILYWVFVRVVERRPAVDELGVSGSLTELGLGFGGGLAISIATFAILFLLGNLRIIGFNPPHLLLLPFVVQLCTAVIMEILLRGLLFRMVERLLGSWLALLLTAILFGAIPLLSSQGTPLVALAFVFETGLICAAAYMVTRRLWAAIGIDAAWNFAQIALYGVAMSDSGPHGFVVSRVVGPDSLTGGRAGMEASAPVLILHAVAIVALLAVAIRRGRIVRPAWRRGRTVRAADRDGFVEL